MITRDNYEEFFLLYIDNELPIADRKAVERFVTDHPDLQEEWETLLQCRIIPEQHLAFPGRDALRQPEISAVEDPGGRPAGSPAATMADRPDLLSYIDGELDDKDREAVEEFVRRHPHSATELEAWRRTISYPDPAVVFPDKASLYKKEGGRKIVLMPWGRIGAAAAIMGAAALLWLLSRPPHREGMAAIPAHSGSIGAVAGPQGTASSRQPAATASDPSATASSGQLSTASSAHPAASSATRPMTENKKNDPAVTPVTTAALYNTGKRNGDAGSDPEVDPGATADRTGGGTGHPAVLHAPEQIQPAGRQEIGANVPMVAQQVSIPREESSFATQALQNETNDPENDSFVADEQAAPGKGKLRGIFRKVTRAFGKTADRDKDGQREVLIGAFQFALK